MKKGRKWLVAIIVLAIACSVLFACSKKATVPSDLPYGDADLSGETAAGLESAAEYRTRFKNGDINIGDVMPYYHDGIYSFFYLAETSNHPVYRVDTTDFVHYEDKGEALAPGASNAQDAMIGTGSIVRAGSDYYFFYTGFKKDNPEAIMLAKSSGNIDAFVKVTDFMFTAASVEGCDLDGWDFRDPEALYDEANERFELYVSARKGGEPVIARFTVSLDLTAVSYGGVVYTDTRFGANVLECSDLFRMGDKWYLTYSVQDTSNGGADGENAPDAAVGSGGKVFYAVSDSPDGPFTRVADAALDSHAFYAAKSIQDGKNTYLAGWIRQKNSNIGWQYMWGGNLQVHQLVQNADGTLSVALPQSIRNYYSVERALDSALQTYNGFDMIAESKDYHVVSGEYSSYLLHTTVSFDADVREFGFALGVSSNTANIMEVAFVPQANKMRSSMAGQQELCSKQIRLVAGEEYDVTLLVEGSAVTVYVDNSVAFTSRIRNLGNKKLAVYALDGSATMKDFHLYTPSEYADTLAAGYGNLTVTEAGAEKKGNVNRVHVSPAAPATIAYTAQQDNYLRLTAAVYAEQAVRVTVKLGANTLREYTAAANKILQIRESAYAAKGTALTLQFASDGETDVWTNVAAETDKHDFAAVAKAEMSRENGAATYTAGESGVYEYVATLYYGGDLRGEPALEAGDSGYAYVTDGARLITLRGAVRLNAGESFTAALAYGKFPIEIGAHAVALQILGGGSSDTFAAGVGTYTKPVVSPCNVVYEVVPTYGDIEIPGGREMAAEMNGDVFGEQGQNGFIYAYGKASDELRPMTEYNTNGEVWDYKHKAPEANDALEIKADYMKQGGGYVTATVWIAPSDGYVDLVADYTRNGGVVQVQVLRNRTLLFDKILKDEEPRVDITLTGIEVKSGDGLALAVRAAGRDMGESDGNYHLRIGKGNSSVPYDPNAPLIAHYADDYNTERNGDYGWQYLDVGYTWDGGEHPTTVTELAASDFGWGSGGKGIDRNGVTHGDAAVAWRNNTDAPLAVSVSGSVSGTGAYVRVWVIRADGGQERVTDGGVNGVFTFPNKGFVLLPGDRIAVLFFDNNGDGCTLDMQVRSSAEIEVASTALQSAIDKAKAIDNTENRYTPDSFAALTAAIAEAENFVRDMSATRKTYAEVSAATKALKAAVSGLKLDVSAAKAELDAAIAAAEKFEGKELLGEKEAFDAALAAAKAAAEKADADSDELMTATAALTAATQNVTIRVADFATDFTGTQGNNGWVFYKIAPSNWDNYNSECTRTELPFVDSAYREGENIVSVDLWKTSGSAVGYRNYTNATHKYALHVKIEYIGDGAQACVAYVILRADGTYSHEANWNTFDKANPHIGKKEFTLGAGDTILLVLRDVDGAPTDSELTLQIGCNDTLTVDTSALQTLIERAEALDGNRYTPESYAALTAAVEAAKAVAAQSSPAAAAVAQAASALTAAIEGLQLNASAAKEELQAQISRAEAFAGKMLLGGRDALDTALAAALAALGNEGATDEELTTAMNALKAELDRAVILVSDIAADFAATQGNKGWFYGKVTLLFNPFRLGEWHELAHNGTHYADGELYISANEWHSVHDLYAAIGYRNYTANEHLYKAVGTIRYTGSDTEACIAYILLKADGTSEVLSEWNPFNAETPHTVEREIKLQPGDTLLFVLRDVGGKDTTSQFTLQIGCNDSFTADTSKLTAAIAAAKLIKSTDYTAESFATLTAAIEAAEAVAANENATAEEVNNAAVALDAAVRGLRYDVADQLAALRTQIEAAEGKQADDYTQASFAALTAALTAARKVAGKENPSPNEVTTATNALTAALNGLAYDTTAVKAELQTVLTEANGKTQADYTEESYHALTTAVTAAQAVYKNADATPAEVRAQITAVRNAIDGLKFNNAAAIAELQKQIEAAKAFEGKTLLIGSDEFAAALQSAKALDENAENETAATLQEAAKRLQDAIAAAVIQAADLTADFSANQGDGGWVYAVADNHGDWDHFANTTFAELPYAENKYIDGSHAVTQTEGKIQIAGGMTSVLYRNYTNAEHAYRVRATFRYLPESGKAAVVIGVKQTSGAFAKIGDAWREFTPENALTIDETVTLGAGEVFAMILRNDGDTPTDTELTVQIGCNDALTVDRTALQALVADAEGKQESDYTPESFAALAAPLATAKTVAENENATAGEVYRATAPLRAALDGLVSKQAITSTTQGDVLTQGDVWNVYRSGIAWDPARLVSENMTAYTYENGGWALGENESVKAGENALLLSSDNAGVALLFRVQVSGTYRLTGTYTGANKTNARIFAGESELTEKAFIGTAESFEQTVMVAAGEYIAIHFECYWNRKEGDQVVEEHNLKDALLTFTLALQPTT